MVSWYHGSMSRESSADNVARYILVRSNRLQLDAFADKASTGSRILIRLMLQWCCSWIYSGQSTSELFCCHSDMNILLADRHTILSDLPISQLVEKRKMLLKIQRIFSDYENIGNQSLREMVELSHRIIRYCACDMTSVALLTAFLCFVVAYYKNARRDRQRA
jgi:hypothetical protein